MAAVDEEEEEEEEEEDDDFVADDRDEVAEAAAAIEARAAQRAMAATREEGVEELERMAAQYAAKARAARLQEEAGAAAALGSGVARRPPTHADPKLWLVAARTGKEKEAAICLMQKAVDRAAARAPLGVTAVVAHDHLKGYIYVEAHKEAHVVDAVRGLRTVYGSKPPKLVPLGEMGAALAVAPPPRARARHVVPGCACAPAPTGATWGASWPPTRRPGGLSSTWCPASSGRVPRRAQKASARLSAGLCWPTYGRWART